MSDIKKEEKFHSDFNKIENFFKSKQDYIEKLKNISYEELINNAPKYYAFINFLERLNVFLSKDKNWLSHFIEKNNYKFDFKLYERWKASKNFDEKNLSYNNTQSPSKWIHVLQDYFIDLLESLQVLLVLEYYISEDDYKKFLKDNPKIFFKLKINYTKNATPSENIELFFEVIDFLLELNREHDFLKNLVVDTTLCIKAYRKIDSSKIFELLRQKEFYIKYRLLYLTGSDNTLRKKIPYESDVVQIAEKFLQTYADLYITYNEYKKRLIEKQNSVKM